MSRDSVYQKGKHPHISKADIVKATHSWKEENLSKNHAKLDQCLTLQEGEKLFVYTILNYQKF